VKAIGYAGLSTLGPTPNNLNLDDQDQLIADYVKERGWTLSGMFLERKTTSNDLEYPKLEEILKAAQRKEFDVLVIARLDRLTRNIRHLNTIISTICIKNNIGLVSIEEGLNTFEESGRLALNIIGIITKWDNKRISDRTREIIAQKRERGERVGHAPFGFTYQNKKLVEVKGELDVVKLIREKRDSGMSYHKVAKLLNDRKINSKRGGIWYAETVKTVYQSELYGPILERMGKVANG